MQAKATLTILAGATAVLMSAAAGAVTCYTVLDRSENVIYRGTLSPVDLSDKGQPEREAMRRRGEHMIAMETDRCIGVEFFTGAAGSPTLTVDQIVGGIPMARNPAISGQSTSTPLPGSSAPVAAPSAGGSRGASPGMSSKGSRSSY